MSAPARPVPVLRVLSRRNFWPYFVGNLLSNAGTWFQNIAQVLLVYRLTGSSFLVGVVNFSQFAAVIFLAPFSGPAADRFDRRRLVAVTQLTAAALAGLLASLTAAGRAGPAVVIGLALALGVTTAFATPALQSLVPSLVDEDEIQGAVALTAVTFNLSRVVGPVAGVAVIAALGIPAAFALNSLSYLSLVAAMAAVRPRRPAGAPAGRTRLRDSIALVRSDPHLLAPLVVVGLVSLTADPVNTLTPGFSTEVYRLPDTFTGVLVGAFGAGAVSAAFLIGGRAKPTYRRITVTLATMGVGMVAFALSRHPAVGLAGLVVAGFGYLSSVTAATSMLHARVDDAHRGRVMALWSLSFHGSRPVGSLVDGALASLLSLRAAGIAMSLPGLVGAAGLAVLRRRRSAGGGRPPATGERTATQGSPGAPGRG